MAVNALDALEQLRQELAALGWSSRMQRNCPHPYLRVDTGDVHGLYVFVAACGQPCYTWGLGLTGWHPLTDVAGAAKTIADDLGRQ